MEEQQKQSHHQTATAHVLAQQGDELRAVMLSLHNAKAEVHRLAKRRDELIMGSNTLTVVSQVADRLRQVDDERKAAADEIERKKNEGKPAIPSPSASAGSQSPPGAAPPS